MSITQSSEQLTPDRAMCERFGREITDAVLLLDFAVSQGRALDASLIPRIKKGQTYVRDGTAWASDEQRSDFEAAYRDLAQAMRPVTAATLAATTDPETGWKRSLARRFSARLYLWVFACALFILVDTVLSTRFPAPAEVKAAAPSTQAATLKTGEGAAPPAAPAQGTPVQTPAAPAQGTSAQTPAAPAQGASPQAPAAPVQGTPVQAPAAPAQGTPAQTPATPAKGTASHTPAPSDRRAEPEPPSLADWGPVARAVTNTLLPFVFGFVGALTFLLRSAHSYIAERSFDMNRRPEYYNRMVLGFLAGGVGLLFVQKSMPLGQNAVSFLFGYNTDFLFQTIERVAQAVFPKDGKPPAAAVLGAVSLSPDVLSAGDAGNGTVSLTAVAPAGGVLVTLTADTGIDLPATPLSIPEGSKSASFAFKVARGQTPGTKLHVTAKQDSATMTASVTVK